MELCPQQQRCLGYMKTHESELREIAKAWFCELMDTLPLERFENKFIAGARAHGPMPLKHDWGAEAVDEGVDFFCYVAKLQEEASLHPVLDETN